MPFTCFKSWKDWPATSSQCPPSVPWYLDLFRPWYLARKSVTEVSIFITPVTDFLSSLLTISAMSTTPHFLLISSLHIIVFGLPSWLTDWLTFFQCYLSLASFIFSAMSTTSHLLLISSIHVSDWLLFMSSYYMFIPSQPCFLHLLCNVYHSTFSPDLFIPNYRLRSPHISISDFLSFLLYISPLPPSSSLQCLPLHIFFWPLHSILSLHIVFCLPSSSLYLYNVCDRLSFNAISALPPSSSLQCPPPHIFFWSLHSMSLIGSPSSLLNTCPCHLSLASFIFCLH